MMVMHSVKCSINVLHIGEMLSSVRAFEEEKLWICGTKGIFSCMSIYSYFMFCSRNDKLNFNTWRHLRASDILSDITCKTEWYTPVPIRELTTSVESILLRVCFVIKVNRNTLYVIIPGTPRMCVRVCVCVFSLWALKVWATHIFGSEDL